MALKVGGCTVRFNQRANNPMKIGFCADIHLGNHGVLGGESKLGMNRRCWDVVKTIQGAVKVALAQKCSELVVVGDLFDSTKPTPQMINAAQSALKSIPTTILVGNHEHGSTDPGDHALSAMWTSAKVIERPNWELLHGRGQGDAGAARLLCIPCIPHPAEKWFDDEVAKLAKALDTLEDDLDRLLCFHLGVADGATPFYLQGAKDSIHVDRVLEVCEKYHITAAFAGNWHNQQVWENRVFQIGALAPTGFDNPGIVGYGGLAIYDTRTAKTSLFEIPGPRFIALKAGDSIAPLVTASKAGNTVYARWTCSRTELPAIREQAQELVKQGVLTDYKAEADKKSARAAAHKAAAQVRQAQSMQEAIVASVKAQDVKSDLAPEIVKRVEHYLTM